jgi:hypothetical protein
MVAKMNIEVMGVKEIEAALMAMTSKKRQSVEKKAARASMNKLKISTKAAWSSAQVNVPTKPKKYSIRKQAARSVKIKVGTQGSGGRKTWVQGKSAGHTKWDVYARLYHDTKKKNAPRARLAHLLEWPHKMPQGGTALGKYVVTKVFNKHADRTRSQYMKALMLWILRPRAKQTIAKATI